MMVKNRKADVDEICAASHVTYRDLLMGEREKETGGQVSSAGRKAGLNEYPVKNLEFLGYDVTVVYMKRAEA